MIYILMTAEDYESKQLEKYLALPTSAPFVHCCDRRQVFFVRDACFPPEATIIALEIDPTTLDSETRYEPGVDGEEERFPHVYGPIGSSDVMGVIAVTT